MRRLLVALGICIGLTVPSLVCGQGLLIDERPDSHFRLPRPHHPPRPAPEPPRNYRIKQLAIQAGMNDQIAKVQVTQSFVNTGSVPLEVSFVFPLPYDGAIDRLTFMVDGKEFEAKLLDAAEARRIYEGYIRRNQDPALLEWVGVGMFKTSVFPVPPGAERTVTIRYTQICRKVGGLSEFLFPLSTAKFTSQPVEKVELQVNLRTQSPLKNVYSPSHTVDIKRPGDNQAIVNYQGTNEVPLSDFRLLFDEGAEAVGARVLSYRPAGGDEGYFLLLVSPEIKKSSDELPRKNIVFVVDRSGSMSGKKMEQARNALKFVLSNLREGDTFNIVAYDTEVESFRPEAQRFNEESRRAALAFVDGIYAGGSTNIDGALRVALGQLADESRPSYIVFLTDGLPTVGVTAEAQIAANALERNKVRARLFTFGVGYDVNSRLLDRLARNGFGQSEYVRPNEDIEAHVAKLYQRIGAPVLTDVAVRFELDGVAEPAAIVNRVYPKSAYDLFAGDQLVLAGRYKHSGAAKVTIEGTVEGKKSRFQFPAQLVEQSVDDSWAFIERVWAARRVGEIIDQIDLHGKNNELVDELIGLSKRHGIITPYTSFLADDRMPSGLAAGGQGFGGAGASPTPYSRKGGAGPGADLARRATLDQLDSLKEESGVGGLAQRSEKRLLSQAATAPAASFGFRYREAKTDREVEVRTVQSIGRKTFFLRQDKWVDSSINDENPPQATAIKRYSAEYFALIDRHGREAARFLTIEGTVLIALGGKLYEISAE
jgi:Ca-activated chloride channel family protein